MSDPLRIAFEVACTIDRAFVIWTERINAWWPADHTMTGAPAAIVLEGRIGGRIYERTKDGDEHDWGVVTGWRPPVQLSYSWHLGVGPEMATDVEIRFTGLNEHRTRIEIEQSGWERLGAAGSALRGRNQVGWESLLPYISAAMEKGA